MLDVAPPSSCARRPAGPREGAPFLTTLDNILARLDHDRDKHMLSPAAPPTCSRWSASSGVPLPDAVRRLLERVGGGILYERHELFGPRRLMIHDIELVPDVLSVRRALRTQPRASASTSCPCTAASSPCTTSTCRRRAPPWSATMGPCAIPTSARSSP